MHQNLEGASGGAITFGAAGLTIGGTASKARTSNNIDFVVDGKFDTLLAADDLITFSSGHTALAAGETCFFGVWIVVGNTISTTQGKIVATADVTAGKTHVPFPDKVADKALLGLIQVATVGAATFTPGSTNLSASNVFDAYTDCAVMPTVPVTTYPSA